jgi:hypothetical protein
MLYDVPHCITSLLRERAASAVQLDFTKLVPGLCLEKGVRHFMTAFNVQSEGGGCCSRDATRQVQARP